MVFLGGMTVVLIGGYWCALTLIRVPGFGAGYFDSYRNLPAYIDRAVFGINHLWLWYQDAGWGRDFRSGGTAVQHDRFGHDLRRSACR